MTDYEKENGFYDNWQYFKDYDFKNEQCKRLEKTLVKVVSSKVPPI